MHELCEGEKGGKRMTGGEGERKQLCKSNQSEIGRGRVVRRDIEVRPR